MSPRSSRSLAAAVGVVVTAGGLFSAGCSDGRSLRLDDLRNSKAPYFYVGRSFDGLPVTHVERYHRGVATLVYGTCTARSDQGCAPPLELQHWLCQGRVTVAIFADRARASRAAKALRPLSRGASGRRPAISYNLGAPCL